MSNLVPVQRELSSGCPHCTYDAAFEHMEHDWRNCGAYGGMYALYQKMEDADAHLFATLQTRKNALLACGYKVVPADGTPLGQRAADRVRDVIAAIPNFHVALFHLLDAFAKGFALAEIMWRVDARTGAVTIEAIRGREQSNFAFDADGGLWLLEPLSANARGNGNIRVPDALLPRPGETRVLTNGATWMPDRKFLHLSFQGNSCSPYGSGLCAKAYWYYLFKKLNLRFWKLYNERFGAPTALAQYKAGATEEYIEFIKETIAGIQHEATMTLPDDVVVQLLEAKRSGGADTYRDFADWCNDEISKIVLGQTLTSSEGRRSGSLALANVHDRVRRDYLAADARMLSDLLTMQLARWITDFNFGPDVAAPRIVFDCSDAADFTTELQLDRELVKMGVSLPANYFYEKYRRPRPHPGDRALRYDDANLYQYHLMFGVLTINEVRATLGLPSVAWGDHPPQPASSGHAGLLSGNLAARSRGDTFDGDRNELDAADEARRDRKAR